MAMYIWRSNEGERDGVQGREVRRMSTGVQNYSRQLKDLQSFLLFLRLLKVKSKASILFLSAFTEQTTVS